ncbi:SMIM4 [Branchiostoma lanceolatum]|uniref:SMIM4 protein n=1 Tax=Branchiostoma lanceolatum TaxID=7740 RepID=A0A8J9ZR12_BRALA|nr:SMIM4 [Branchiostoma lanceolatum]
MVLRKPNRRIRGLLELWPGKRRLGVYRFLPVFFVMGAGMEWFMINVRLGRETFYDVYRRKQAERQYEAAGTETSNDQHQ